MSAETYLNHPTFGLLYRVCELEHDCELFTTLYAQRLFFLVRSGPGGLEFESLTRAEARLMVENRLRVLRRNHQTPDYNRLQAVHQRTFFNLLC